MCPVYSFSNKETGEEYEMTLTYDELNQYLQNHPEVNQTFRMNLVDPVGIGVTKPPSDFMKNVIGKVKQAPGANQSAIEKRWTIPKEI
jgi:hypothetical protein